MRLLHDVCYFARYVGTILISFSNGTDHKSCVRTWKKVMHDETHVVHWESTTDHEPLRSTLCLIS